MTDKKKLTPAELLAVAVLKTGGDFVQAAESSGLSLEAVQQIVWGEQRFDIYAAQHEYAPRVSDKERLDRLEATVAGLTRQIAELTSRLGGGS